MASNWRGVFPAITSQFHADQSQNIEGTLQHLEQLIEAGIHGVIFLGTVGENCSHEYSEKLALLKAAVAHVNGRIPVLSGVAEYTTALAARYAKDAEQCGVNGLMVLPGMVYKSDARETITHFRTVARATPLPIMCYNNPVSYGVDITPAMFAELSDEPTLAAIKESQIKDFDDLQNTELLTNRLIRTPLYPNFR